MKKETGYFSLFSMAGFAALFLSLAAPQTPRAAAAASVGQDDGYSGRILDKIVAKWKAPKQKMGSHRLKLILSVDGDGRLLDCRVQKSSGLDGFDAAVCDAAKAASPYGTPPYGMPATLYFSFWSGGVSQDEPEKRRAPWDILDDRSGPAAKAPAEAAPAAASPAAAKAAKSYEAKITRELRNSMYVPKEAKPGVYHVSVSIECDRQGKILSSKILKGSNDARVDKYVMQGIARAGRVSPPPEALGNKFDLTFTMIRQGGKAAQKGARAGATGE